MKEATGETSMTMITIVAIAAISALVAFLWPTMKNWITDEFNEVVSSGNTIN